MDTTIQDPLVGRVLDRRYQVASRLARGGMATVYEALDTRLDRNVALKVMHADLAADPEFVSRFIREAKSAARLSHPNIVAVYDQGTDAGHVFLAMEYIEGQTLRDVLRRWSRFSPAEAFTVLEPVLAALSAAHAAGLVHRDVKPENVLLADDGRVKVADFGLVRAVSTVTDSSTAGALLGSVNYLAPEQVQRGVADRRSDVYAAGILLYEMLTGEKPHDGDNPIHVVYRHVHEDVPAPSALVPGLPAAVDTLVRSATARDPDGRPADAAAFLTDLRATRNGLSEDELAGSRTGSRSLRRMPAAGATDTIAVPLPDEPPDPIDSIGAIGPAGRAAAGARGGARVRTARQGSGWVAFVVILGFALAVSTAAWWLGSGRYISAPSVLRLSQAAAEQRITEAGLEARVQRAFDEAVPKGQVTRSDPKPGTRVLRGATITVFVSAGPERIAVPAVAGKPLTEARRTLDRNRLRAADPVQERFSGTAAEGEVIRTSPEAGSRVRPDSQVTLVVSKGPAPIDVPDVVGRELDDALRRLSRAGLSGTVAGEVFSDSVDRGAVIRQDPGGADRAGSGDSVQLFVSKGPELVAVPDVQGLPLDEARRALDRAGFEARSVDLVPGGPNRVRAQLPRPGRELAKGSTVTLSVL